MIPQDIPKLYSCIRRRLTIVRKIIVNGKFLSAEMTGVHRVAAELLKSAVALQANCPDQQKRIDFELWVPHDGVEGARALALPFKVVGPLRGIAWEQLSLPLRAKGQMVLSLCNVGPMLSRNAMTMFHDAQVRITPKSYAPAFRAWYWLHQGAAGRRHRRILTVSQFSRGQIARFDIAAIDKIGVVPNGVDHVLEIHEDHGVIARLGLQPHRYVVALANVQAHKNIAVLLKAFADPALGDVKLVLFGSASRQDFERAGYAVPPNAVFAGRIGDGELRTLYGQAACIAFPSTTEGFGLPPLEAMLVGCPAVVAPEGALPEICGSAVLYVDARDPAGWARELARVVSDQDLRGTLAEAGRRQAGRFTWRSAASRMIEEILALPA
jgi:hypothetical protein